MKSNPGSIFLLNFNSTNTRKKRDNFWRLRIKIQKKVIDFVLVPLLLNLNKGRQMPRKIITTNMKNVEGKNPGLNKKLYLSLLLPQVTNFSNYQSLLL